MREADPAWRSRDLPPSPLMSYDMAKVISWLERGGDINETRIPGYRGRTMLVKAVIDNNETLVAELCNRGAVIDVYDAQGKNAYATWPHT